MRANLTVPSLVDALAAAIRERILTGDVPGGAPLTEKEVSTFYDVARPTAKAAIERLVYEGILRRGPNKTARVPLMDADDIRDLYYSRGFLEREVVAALATARMVPDEARAAIAQLHEAIRQEGAIAKTVQADITFHRSLVNALDSPRLTRMYRSVIGETHLCMAQVQAHHLLSPTVIAAEHEGIIQAISDADPEAAADQVTRHLNRARTQLASYVASDPARSPGGDRPGPLAVPQLPTE
jgi:DNA-binding GntR family transcriptional regulator